MAGKIATEIANGTPLAPATELVLNIYRTAAELQLWTTRLLRPVDLRPDEYNILRILRGAEPTGHPRAEVERRLLHGPERVGASLHRLKSRDLVTGVFHLRISEHGLELLTRVDGLLEDAIRERTGMVSDADLQTTIATLERIRHG